MSVLCIDQATVSGFCVGPVGCKRPVMGTLTFPKLATLGLQLVWYRRRLAELLVEHKVQTVVRETVWFGRFPNVVHVSKAYKIVGVIELVAGELGAAVNEMEPSTWRSSIGAPTKAPRTVSKNNRRPWLKDATQKTLRLHGYAGWANNDEADALGLWIAATAQLTGQRSFKAPELAL